MREIIKYGLILGLICFLASSVLAIVNNITEPIIKLQKENQESSALKEVMAESISFKPHYQDEKIMYWTAFDSNNSLNGLVLKCQAKGFSSTIEILAGLNLHLEITNIKIISQNETPNLGTRILEASFLGQFRAKNLDSLSQVQAITGATISSRALINALKLRLFELKEQLTQELANAR